MTISYCPFIDILGVKIIWEYGATWQDASAYLPHFSSTVLNLYSWAMLAIKRMFCIFCGRFKDPGGWGINWNILKFHYRKEYEINWKTRGAYLLLNDKHNEWTGRETGKNTGYRDFSMSFLNCVHCSSTRSKIMLLLRIQRYRHPSSSIKNGHCLLR